MKNSAAVPLGPASAATAPARPLSTARAAILDRLRSKRSPATVEELARETGQHPNTVREHLEALTLEGLATRSAAAARGRGRPAMLYQASEAPEGSAQYAALAAMLAGEIERLAPDPVGAGREAGVRWAQETFGPSAGPVSADDARRRVLAELERLGFGVEDAGGPTVRLVTCPLLSAARAHSGVVCAVHAGLVEEALRLLGRDDIPSRLEPFAEPGACLLTLGDPAPAEGTR
ncbi:helix-turn-helix transcriptional regulator [Sinomonas terrae]|uniref:Helix-turn-helix domain-containing protein n=1 Tax=Sinomonas terrae TaxID=2908838 RepID=A0ABS9U818_9MICC|nr:helix-turn-helix domain-containing protein [Sinomonas terrae]MCH6472512.1 helix-turn-helix domain-containing protein [Sinomonas terrae]